MTVAATTDLVGKERTTLIPVTQETHPGDIFLGFSSPKKAAAVEKGYTFSPLSLLDLQDVLTLQGQVMDALEDKSWLRSNTEDGIRACLDSHVSVGVRLSDSLVAAAILYDGGETNESIRGYFTDNAQLLESSVNLKLVLAAPGHRGVGLGRTLVELLHQQAVFMGKEEIACTIHPKNLPSQALFSRIGYQHIGDVASSYGERSVFARSLR